LLSHSSAPFYGSPEVELRSTATAASPQVDIKIDVAKSFASPEPHNEFREDSGHMLETNLSTLLKASSDGDAQNEELPDYMIGRLVVDTELERNLLMKPFHEIALFTGSQTSQVLGRRYQQIGTWKGLIRLLQSQESDPDSDLTVKEMLKPQALMLRLYILRGSHLMPKDRNGKCDPFLVLHVGKHTVSTRNRHLKETLDPGFFESFEIPITIPGDGQVLIEVFDCGLIRDDLIGSTLLDIEDRWFSKSWRSLLLKPVEVRTLHCPTSRASQGQLSLWFELLTLNEAKMKSMWNIKPPPPQPFELRVIIWGCRDIPNKDTATEANDMYVTCQPSLPGLKRQETDTHFRAHKGVGNFNWRMKWKLTLPIEPWPRLRFQVWDRDLVRSNEFICEATIAIKGLCKQTIKTGERTKIIIKGKERFWLEKMGNANEAPNSKTKGRMEISVELLPSELTEQLPAGFGRSSPNTNPVLPEPEGRLHWSLLMNPFALLRSLLGDRICFKLCLSVCCLLLVLASTFLGPMIVSNLVSSLLLPR